MRLLLFCLLLSFPVMGLAQTDDSLKVREDVRFTHYLVTSGQYNDAIYFINHLDLNRTSFKSYLDSIYFLKGWAYYSTKTLDSASHYFLLTTPQTSLGVKSRFFSAYNYIYKRNFAEGDQILQSMALPDSQLIELRFLQQAGIALLNRNFSEFEQIRGNFTDKWYSLSETEGKLNDYYDILSTKRMKSPWIAGAMSMIVPGSGKIYAGKVGEGISALFSNAILAGITIENYRKAGPRNFKTIFFGSLFTIFYCGNVYGSMISVQVVNNEFNSIYDNKILFDIHIPLRTIFN
ncbi:MAG TPA: hypothetical protein VHO90_10670 [Bacteroidales bacterium]|nr:hypothetical protein [Bacteroidales bacterium]